MGLEEDIPLAQQLGFESGDRVAIIHCDDIGMCHAANLGAFEALDAGPATCGSVMVPCPWFAEAAEMAQARPGVDLGVHLTLNSEWSHYRWGPVLGASAVPSLVAEDGAFYRTTIEALSNADPEEAEQELRAQIDRALAAGIDVTHLDAHMGTAMFPPLHEIYLRLSISYCLPIFFFRPSEALLGGLGTGGEVGRTAIEMAERAQRQGIPLLDGFDADSLSFAPGEGAVHNRARLAGLGEGINYLICHPAQGGEELSAITDSAHCRSFEKEFYGGPEGAAALEDAGLLTVGMRPLRELMRAARS